MPPGVILAVVDRRRRLTFRAHPTLTLRQHHRHVPLARGPLHFHYLHAPGGLLLPTPLDGENDPFPQLPCSPSSANPSDILLTLTWTELYNQRRPHSALGCRPLVPAAILMAAGLTPELASSPGQGSEGKRSAAIRT